MVGTGRRGACGRSDNDTVSQLLEYERATSVRATGDEWFAELGTVGGSWLGTEATPVFFDGIVARAGALATAMTVLGRVARTRYYTPPGMVAAKLRSADPVMTSTPAGLRMEAFSPCGGVYARFDLTGDAVDIARVTSGVTNVDFNADMRALLATVTGDAPMHLSATAAGIDVTTVSATVHEAKVVLPQRWVRGFAETQVVARAGERSLDVGVPSLQRLVTSLPKATPTRSIGWLSSAAGAVRLASSPSSSAVPLAGPERLRIIEPILRFATSARVVWSERATASFWIVETPLGRLTIGLSPEKSRGFSGEGALLENLADESLSALAFEVADELHFESSVDVPAVALALGSTVELVEKAMERVAAHGLIGFDLSTQSWFHRPLPFSRDRTESLNPRLASARDLVERVVADGDGRFHIHGLDYRIRLTPEGDHCTCPWYGRHSGARGPCKHVLAARLSSGQRHE
jgi:hypothetical protein